ncbi:unnamed protein product [[Candida] boidinii]|uniref:Unnamed protein product n=1 Tax=Candida boidinii TaxID=5477 RepID=A0A9W6WKK2_CANBO|nr:unnamed protein product [[Candida] boidinii]
MSENDENNNNNINDNNKILIGSSPSRLCDMFDSNVLDNNHILNLRTTNWTPYIDNTFDPSLMDPNSHIGATRLSPIQPRQYNNSINNNGLPQSGSTQNNVLQQTQLQLLQQQQQLTPQHHSNLMPLQPQPFYPQSVQKQSNPQSQILLSAQQQQQFFGPIPNLSPYPSLPPQQLPSQSQSRSQSQTHLQAQSQSQFSVNQFASQYSFGNILSSPSRPLDFSPFNANTATPNNNINVADLSFRYSDYINGTPSKMDLDAFLEKENVTNNMSLGTPLDKNNMITSSGGNLKIFKTPLRELSSNTPRRSLGSTVKKLPFANLEDTPKTKNQFQQQQQHQLQQQQQQLQIQLQIQSQLQSQQQPPQQSQQPPSLQSTSSSTTIH